jgi:hypothetical protein
MATVVAAGLGVALAYAFLRHAESTPEVGPTAASLNEAFSALFGAGIGLALGSALCAISVRRGSRLISGLTAGLIAYVVALAPVFIFTGPSDASRGEMIAIAAYLILPLGAFALIGAALGRFIAPFLPRGHSPARGR